MPHRNTNQPLDPDLLRKAKTLRKSEYFVRGFEHAPLVGKQQIFLVLAGLKPVSEATSGHRIVTRGNEIVDRVPDDPDEMGAFLESLGLHYRLRSDDHATDVLVSLNEPLIEEYRRCEAASDMQGVGRLFGYPESAVSVYPEGSLSSDEQDRIEDETGVDPRVSCFRFSVDHWREELETVFQWMEVLRRYDLLPPLRLAS